MRLGVVAAATAAAVVCAGSPAAGGITDPTSTTAPRSETARLSPSSCRFVVPAGYDVTCHVLDVPEVYPLPGNTAQQERNRNRVRLHVALYRSLSRTPAPDRVVFLAGGPGDNATDATRDLVAAGAFDEVLALRDLVVLDQRGSGRSVPSLACLGGETLESCRARLAASGIDLGGYTNEANATDVAALTRALGSRRVNLFGVSYGTRLALTVVRDHPALVRSLVLDSVAPPHVALGVATVASFERSFDALFRACEALASCRRDFPGLRGTFDRVVSRLQRDPVALGSVFGPAGDPDERITGADFALLIWELLQTTDAIPYIPLLIDSTDRGDLESVLDFVYRLGGGAGISVGANYSIECTGPERLQTDRDLAEAGRSLRPSIRPAIIRAFADLADACRTWGVPATSRTLPPPVRSRTPALLLSGALDSSTPPSFAATAARTLTSAVQVTIPGSGHVTFARNSCSRQIIGRFLSRPGQRPDTSCTRRRAPLSFLADWPTPPGEPA